jgi:hypothetical protein
LSLNQTKSIRSTSKPIYKFWLMGWQNLSSRLKSWSGWFGDLINSQQIWRHDNQHKDTQDNDIPHNYTQHNGLNCDTQHTISITRLSKTSSIFLLSVPLHIVMLSVILPSVVLLSVVMLNVVALKFSILSAKAQ